MTNDGNEMRESAEQATPAPREQWSSPTFYRVNASAAELSASDSGGDIVWS